MSINPLNIKDREFQKFTESPDVTGKPLVEVLPTSKEYKTIIDQVSGNLQYIGYALPSSLESAAVWRIERITKSGSITKTEFAGGSQAFSNIWNNRASLSYS